MNYLTFRNDKSQLIRGIAIIFMIMLHNNCGAIFQICISLFTFLVGYGYCFAKHKNFFHAIKRSWNLLSHFWLILFGIFLPIAVVKGDYHFTFTGLLEEMFGLESKLNWYSWYVYFYIYAMLIMPWLSKIIDRFKMKGSLCLTVAILTPNFFIHMIPGWADNIWWKAAFDCFLCSPAMIAGYYCAKFNFFAQIKLIKSKAAPFIYLLIAVASFLARFLPLSYLYNFALTTVFVYSFTAIFETLNLSYLQKTLVALGKESMNMWFLHAMFFTTVTAATTGFLVNWAQPKVLHIIWMIGLSYVMAQIVNWVYDKISKYASRFLSLLRSESLNPA